MRHLTDDEIEMLLNKALLLCNKAIYLLDESYEAHCKEKEKRLK